MFQERIRVDVLILVHYLEPENLQVRCVMEVTVLVGGSVARCGFCAMCSMSRTVQSNVLFASSVLSVPYCLRFRGIAQAFCI